MARDDYRNDDDRPRRWRELDDDYYRDGPRRKPRSGAVTALAVVNFIVGPLVLVFGICAALLTNVVEPTLDQYLLGIPGGLDSRLATNTVMVLIFCWGAAAIVIAIGLLYRGGWARILGLLNAGCALAVGLIYLTLTILFLVGTFPNSDERAVHAVLSLATTVFFLGYGLWMFFVLLNPKRVEEFR